MRSLEAITMPGSKNNLISDSQTSRCYLHNWSYLKMKR